MDRPRRLATEAVIVVSGVLGVGCQVYCAWLCLLTFFVSPVEARDFRDAGPVLGGLAGNDNKRKEDQHDSHTLEALD